MRLTLCAVSLKYKPEDLGLGPGYNRLIRILRFLRGKSSESNDDRVVNKAKERDNSSSRSKKAASMPSHSWITLGKRYLFLPITQEMSTSIYLAISLSLSLLLWPQIPLHSTPSWAHTPTHTHAVVFLSLRRHLGYIIIFILEQEQKNTFLKGAIQMSRQWSDLSIYVRTSGPHKVLNTWCIHTDRR